MGDHFFSVNQIDSIEPYLLLALAARETERVRIGPFVTPVMFRPPSNVGRLAAQLDLLSGGRFVMGLGAGWHEGEHTTYGVDYPSLGERFDRLDEYIAVMQGDVGRRGRPRSRGAITNCARPRRCRSRPRGARRCSLRAGARSAPCRWWRSTRTSGTAST